MSHSSPPQGPIVRLVPEGDNRPRLVCQDCGFVHYENPKVVVGSVIVHDERIVLCRRAIEPRRGFWTLPAGFMEMGETSAEGARREALEEACADIEIGALLAVYDIPRISQVQIMYLATLKRPHIAAGTESLEVGLFAWDEIPWSELAFPSVRWALEQYQEVKGRTEFATRRNPPGELGNY